jgi:PhoH-like ATPase
MKVLEEIDKHKKRQDSVGTNARNIIREFDLLRERGSLQNGVSLGNELGILRVSRIDVEDIPPDFDESDPDHIIMTAAISEQKKNPDKKIIIVSRDINMRVMTDSLGIISEDYIENQVIKVQSDLYTGFDTILVSDEDIDDIYSDNLFPSYLDNVDLNNNQSIMMVSEINEKKSVLCRYRNGKFRKVLDLNA